MSAALGGEPNAGDHGEGEDGVHHFGLARAAASAARRGMLGRALAGLQY